MLAEIIAYESGQMDTPAMVEFFGKLIESGMAWQLQGNYGRTARDLIDAGLINEDGSIDWEFLDE